MALLEVNNVVKSYDGREVLKGISVSVDRGDFISIIGASGSGKSTLLNIIGGMDRPDSGSVILDGEDVTTATEKRLAKLRRTELGFIFQFFNLAPYLTAEENIELPLVLDGKNAKKYSEKIRSLAEYLKIDGILKKLPSELSGGEQQRVAIARGLVYSPSLILLDEPTGNLDSVTAKEIMELLKSINLETETTIIQVTHSMENAAYGNRIIEIKDGNIK